MVGWTSNSATYSSPKHRINVDLNRALQTRKYFIARIPLCVNWAKIITFQFYMAVTFADLGPLKCLFLRGETLNVCTKTHHLM